VTGSRSTRGVTRPVWEPDAGTMALYRQARGIAAELGFDLDHASAGGGSDANFTGAAGIPSLDGLGRARRRLSHAGGAYRGGQPGTQRARLIAGLLARLSG
jgi:glutamate carboxypeptidase